MIRTILINNVGGEYRPTPRLLSYPWGREVSDIADEATEGAQEDGKEKLMM